MSENVENIEEPETVENAEVNTNNTDDNLTGGSVETSEPQENANPEEGENKEETQEEKPEKKKTTIEERVATLKEKTWEMREAERKANKAIERLEQLQNKTETLVKPDINNYDNDESYHNDVSTYYEKLAQQNAVKNHNEKLQQDKQQTITNRNLSNWEVAKNEEMEKDPNFELAEMNVGRVFRKYKAEHLAQVVTASKKGVQIIQYLNANKEVLNNITSLSPIEAVKELGAIEYKLKSKPTKKTTTAPAPVSPSTSAGSAPKDLSKLNDLDYAAERDRQRAGKA